MIQIIRLKNGEDIIGEVFEDIRDELEIDCPMTVDLEYHGNQSGLVMAHWLPVQLIEKNMVKIKSCDVLTRFYPNNEFAEYYTNTVSKLKDLLKAKKITDALTDEEVEDIMDALDDGQGQTLH